MLNTYRPYRLSHYLQCFHLLRQTGQCCSVIVSLGSLLAATQLLPFKAAGSLETFCEDLDALFELGGEPDGFDR